MHPEAMAYVTAAVQGRRFATVIDLGGRDVNGSPRHLFDTYVALDVVGGAGVDIVADAATWEPDRAYDLALCLEVFEHTPDWPAILRTCAKAAPMVVVTAACDPRAPHSAIDGGPLRDGEHYANVNPDELRQAAEDAGFTVTDLSTHPRGDVYLTARA